MRNIVVGAVAYLVITFTLAVLWHVVVFESVYIELGYFGNQDPKFSLGFLAIATQGALLSFLFPRFRGDGSVIREGLKFGAVAGVFLWSAHVVAYAAKAALTSIPVFIGIETVYLVLQMVCVGVAISWAHRSEGKIQT